MVAYLQIFKVAEHNDNRNKDNKKRAISPLKIVRLQRTTGNSGIIICVTNLAHQPSHEWSLIRRKWCVGISFFKDTKTK